MKEFSIRMRVPWSDTDAAGVVHFANYFRYFERVELELYRKLGFAYSKSLMKMGLWFARVEAHCSYLSPCEFDDEIEVKMRLTTLGRRSVKYGMEVLNLTTGKVGKGSHCDSLCKQIKKEGGSATRRVQGGFAEVFCVLNFTQPPHIFRGSLYRFCQTAS